VGDMLLVAKAAEAKKMADSNEFKQKLAYARTKLLMETYLQSEAKAAVTDAELHKVYDEAIGQMKAEPEVHARHILVETEDEAKAVAAELKKGADFADLAKQKSKDPGASDGGDLGWFTKDQMVPEFSEVAFKLDKGQLSDPVKSQFGWHVIKVEDKRMRQPPEFEKVRDQLENFVVRRQQSAVITKLRAEARSSASVRRRPRRLPHPPHRRRSRRSRIDPQNHFGVMSRQCPAAAPGIFVCDNIRAGPCPTLFLPLRQSTFLTCRRLPACASRPARPASNTRVAPTCCWPSSTRAPRLRACSRVRNAHRRRSSGAVSN
jgi:hypothetical protein